MTLLANSVLNRSAVLLPIVVDRRVVDGHVSELLRLHDSTLRCRRTGAGGLYCYSIDFVVGALEQVGYTVIVQTSLSAHWSKWVILL